MQREDRNGKSFLTSLGRGLVYALFLALLAIRAPFKLILRLATGVGAFTGFILLIGSEGMRGLAIGAIGVAFASFVVGWFYDQLLLRLSPQPIALINS